jgi:hypothetical protein
MKDGGGERGSESGSEESCAFGIEVKFIGLVKSIGQRHGVDGNKSFDTGFLGGEKELMDGFAGSGCGRKQNDEFSVVGVAENPKTSDAGIGGGIKK